jgi:group II intron reverse transcriptase/maturase
MGNLLNSKDSILDFQSRLFLQSKKDKNFRFSSLFDKVYSEPVIRAAWKHVRAKKGAAGVDRKSIGDIKKKQEDFIREIIRELKSGTYEPKPARRVWIPKRDGTSRPLGIPTVKDRVVQAAVKMVIEPIFEGLFMEHSYGFRPRRNCWLAVQEIRKYLDGGLVYMLETDIEDFFNRIPHKKLLDIVCSKIADPDIQMLISMWLKCGVRESYKLQKKCLGTPQGGVISPLLANIYLNELDKWWEESFGLDGNSQMIRYADDLVILSKSEPDKLKKTLKVMFGELGLTMKETKTRLLRADEGDFDFLGFNIRMIWDNGREHKMPLIMPSMTENHKKAGYSEKVASKISRCGFTQESYIFQDVHQEFMIHEANCRPAGVLNTGKNENSEYIYVSIVSEQSMPNILFLKHFMSGGGTGTQHIFISTKKMEGKAKSANIQKALKLEGCQISVIEVPEDSVAGIRKILEENIHPAENMVFVVNMTGGTKIMSLAVYEYFLKKNARIYYVEIGRQNIIRIQPEEPALTEALDDELTPEEYITGAGLSELNHQAKALYNEAVCVKMKEWFINSGIKQDEAAFSYLRGRRNESNTEIKEDTKNFLSHTGFSAKSEVILNKDEVQYITGGWFEEYIYYAVKKQLKLEDKAIWLNLKLQTPVKNEIDITFIYKNTLYLIECKTSDMVLDKSIAAEVQYKSSAISRKFGLSVKPYFVTLGNLRDKNGCGAIRKEIIERSEAMGVVVKDRTDVLAGNIIDAAA